jgi:hypothetical protein
MNFVTKVLNKGGEISPLIIPNSFYKGTGLFNPSIYNDDGKIILNLRHCQYTIYHAEKNKFEHQFGPLVYLNPENDVTLTTKNYYCELSNDYTIKKYSIIDTTKLDVKPIWTFIGLEDVRLVRWNGNLYASGVRRDTTKNGQGRMELSTLKVDGDDVIEVERFRIPAPAPDASYCEKNWMPIIDMPYHYVKWSNPTEVVKVNPIEKTCQTVYLGKYVPKSYDYRGGSQVIPFGDHRIACVHVVNLFKSEAGRKNATYRHCFIVWDKDWNVVKYTEPFDFMSAEIEFCAGMAQHDDKILISFGFQDNTAYVLSMSKKFMKEVLDV